MNGGGTSRESRHWPGSRGARYTRETLVEANRAFGRYQVVERVAAGGMGEIYRATAEGIGGVKKTVALKLVRPEFADDPEFVRMFLQEAKLSFQLSHANVVQ